MQITEGTYCIELSRKELHAIVAGLEELDTLRKQYPDARNGYGVMNAQIVSGLKVELRKALFNDIQ